MVTIKDIAAKTGFSPTTISLVMNNRRLARYMSASTRKIIRETAAKLGYRPNIFAQSLRARRSFMVGLLVYDILDPYCAPIVKEIEATLIPHGYTMLISDLGYDQNRYREALDVLTWRRADGIIAIANHFPNDLAALRKAAALTPVVVIGRVTREKDVPCFVVNDRQGGLLAAHHLLQIGHREIGIIWDHSQYEWSTLRWKGVEKAFAAAGRRIDPRNVCLIEEKSSDAGYDAAGKLLAQNPKITAICAVNDLTAIGAVRAVFDSGRSVPDDISVIGFDDLWLARHYNPPLTTVAQPLDRLGQLATQTLLERIAHPKRAMKGATLKPSLVVRRSTARLK
jgi:LacI family transcriptional regulator